MVGDVCWKGVAWGVQCEGRLWVGLEKSHSTMRNWCDSCCLCSAAITAAQRDGMSYAICFGQLSHVDAVIGGVKRCIWGLEESMGWGGALTTEVWVGYLVLSLVSVHQCRHDTSSMCGLAGCRLRWAAVHMVVLLLVVFMVAVLV